METQSATVRQWLLSTPKYVPIWYLYDTNGSAMFETITLKNPEYHIYKTEKRLLEDCADEIVSGLEGFVLSELGAGNCTKTMYLLSALLKKNKSLTYIPIDQAKDFMEHNVDVLMQCFSVGLNVKPYAGGYIAGINHLKGINQNKLIVWFGNSFSNVPMNDLTRLLECMKDSMGDNDRLLVGIDLVQDKERSVNMYSHPETWIPFNLNVLTRLNREFGADFNHDNFRLYTDYVISDERNGIIEKPQYIQHALKSTCDQYVHLDFLDLKIRFETGELLYCHELEYSSLKWNWKQFEDALEKGGFSVDKKWSDKCNSYGLCLLRKLQKT